MYWTEDQLADVSTRLYTSASWTVGELTGYPIQNADSVKKGFFVFKNGEHFFLIGYHFEKFRSQVAIWKKWQTTDECLGAKLRVTENRCVLFDSFTYIYSALLPQHWALYAKADSTPTFIYIYIQFFFLIYIYQPKHGNIYIYIYVAIGGKTERLYFHPFKLISWKQACKDESIVSLFFSPYYNIYHALLLCIEHCKTE